MDVNITIVSILVIIFLFIPGFFFKRFYYTGQFTKQFHSGTFAERFITSIFWGLIIQLISLAFFNSKYDISYDSVIKFYDKVKSNQLPDCSSDVLLHLLIYMGLTVSTAMLLGIISHKFVRVCRLDIHVPVLRFSNYWNYYFKGDLSSLRPNKRGKVISTNLDVITEDGSGATKMYRGFLVNYTISPLTGELETIVLSNSERWSKSADKFKTIPGDSLVIPYKTVININMRYNIKENKTNIRQTFLNAIAMLGLGSILFSMFGIPYIFLGSHPWYWILLVMFLSILDTMLFYSLLIVWIGKSIPKKTQTKEIGILWAVVIIVALILWYIIK